MFSYKDYSEIVELIKASGKQADFYQAQSMDEYVIMRHDVEFSVERAYELSKLELGMDFTSTYFFQWTNNAYNILSRKNMDMIKEMHECGQGIGLHFALNGLTDIEEIKNKIQLEVRVLSEMLGFEINQFSFHRPPADVLRENIKLPGILNAYQDEFFTFGENITESTPLEVKYISDAQHRWNYGLPDKESIMNHKKVQILTHPYSWTPKGYDNIENFKTLIEERNRELIDTIEGECKHFSEIRNLM